MPEEYARPPLWYKDAVIYEVHVRAFQDSNNDGIGDFPGLTSRLDYLSRLGVDTIWLLPFYPSPLRDDGYDIADYYDVHPSYGTLKDFKEFLDRAHARGMRVVTELVINHTSDQHPWFQRARRAAPGTPERDFYVWSDDPDRFPEVRIIFQDTESSNWAWDPVAGSYYWHRFFSHQPDLNYDNPLVHEAVTDTLSFWLDMGVDGVRLDAIPYLFEREGTNGENLPETHEELKRLRAFLDDGFENRMFLAEANQWPEDSVEYFGDGDECHMAFHFPLMPRLYLALQKESRLPIIDILEQTPPIPESAQWAIFLRNHDELTLEMVTEEDRDFMWRMYAPDRRARINLGIRRRLAPLMEGDRRRIELLNGLLLSLPGTPVLYYGDEIGMGDNIFLPDRDGVRTPMQWSNDRNAGFSKANPQSLYMPVVVDPQFHYETVNVEAQQGNPNSLLRWMRRMIARRRNHPEFGRGGIEFLHPDNEAVLAYLRTGEDSTILVVANLSSQAQYVQLDLSRFEGQHLIEILGGTDFPTIGDLPYLLTLTPYGFYWFSVGFDSAHGVDPDTEIPVGDTVEELFSEHAPLVGMIGRHLRSKPWYQANGDRSPDVSVFDVLPMNPDEIDDPLWIALVDVTRRRSTTDRYVVALGMTFSPDAIAEEDVVARVTRNAESGVVFDALRDPRLHRLLLANALEGHVTLGHSGSMACITGQPMPDVDLDEVDDTEVIEGSGDVYIRYGDQMALKLFPRIEPGLNPDLELRRFLTEQTSFDDLADVYGSLEYDSGDSYTIGVLQQSAAGAQTAWSAFASACASWLTEIGAEAKAPTGPTPGWATGDDLEVPGGDALERSLELAELLAGTTAGLHRGLGTMSENPDLAPVPFTTLYQQGLYQSLRSSIRSEIVALRQMPMVEEPDLASALHDLAAAEPEILERIEPVRRTRMSGRRIRRHGDYRLDEVRLVDDRFLLVNLSGDHRRPLSERRLRGSPLRDVAEMLRSLDYVALSTALEAEDVDPGWGHVWSRVVGLRFIRAYLDEMEGSTLLPTDPEAVDELLDAHMLARALRELHWELQVRPDWIAVPLAGIRRMLGVEPTFVG